jgi:hypothetical protein
VTTLLSSPEPPIFHDALDVTLEQIQKVWKQLDPHQDKEKKEVRLVQGLF